MQHFSKFGIDKSIETAQNFSVDFVVLLPWNIIYNNIQTVAINMSARY